MSLKYQITLKQDFECLEMPRLILFIGDIKRKFSIYTTYPDGWFDSLIALGTYKWKIEI